MVFVEVIVLSVVFANVLPANSQISHQDADFGDSFGEMEESGTDNEVSFAAPGVTINIGLSGQTYPNFSERFSNRGAKCLDTDDEYLLNDVIAFVRSNVATNPNFPRSFWLCQNQRTRQGTAPVLRVSPPKKSKGVVYDIGVEGIYSKHAAVVVVGTQRIN